MKNHYCGKPIWLIYGCLWPGMNEYSSRARKSRIEFKEHQNRSTFCWWHHLVYLFQASWQLDWAHFVLAFVTRWAALPDILFAANYCWKPAMLLWLTFVSLPTDDIPPEGCIIRFLNLLEGEDFLCSVWVELDTKTRIVILVLLILFFLSPTPPFL